MNEIIDSEIIKEIARVLIRDCKCMGGKIHVGFGPPTKGNRYFSGEAIFDDCPRCSGLRKLVNV